MKTKKKLKNRIKTSPVLTANTTLPKTGSTRPTTAPKPSTNGKPKPAAPATVPSPIAETRTANGREPSHKYYCYSVHTETGIDNPYLESVVADLAGKKYDNVGALVLAIYAKFVGVRQVTELSLRWVTNTFRMDVMVKLGGWDEAKCVAWFQPTDEWYLNDSEGKEIQRHTPKPYVPMSKPVDPSLLAATKPVKGEGPDEIDDMLAKTRKKVDSPAEKPKTILGVEITKSKKGKPLIFGHHVTAIVRWCGWDSWDRAQVAKLLVALNLADSISLETMDDNLGRGRTNDQSRPIPQLTEAQENALVAAVELTTIKKGKKK